MKGEKNRDAGMNMEKLEIEKFSAAGTYHKNLEAENQDAVSFEQNENFAVIALADGASDCSEAKQGAETACQAAANLLLKKGEYFFSCGKSEIAELVLGHVLYELKASAEKAGQALEAYSSTLACAAFDRKNKKLLLLNLGDSLLLGVRDGNCRVLSMPADTAEGCCMTTTKGAEEKIFVEIYEHAQMDSVIIFSNGAWRALFERNRLSPMPEYFIASGRYERLRRYLEGKNSPDDCSFVSMELDRRKREIA